MEGLFFESSAYKEMMFKLDVVFKLATDTKKNQDEWLTIEEVMAHVKFGYHWVNARRVQMKAFQDGNGLRFKKSNVDKYMDLWICGK